jgi:flagellar M-ring protein FliF
MPGDRNHIIKQLLEIWARLGKSQRITIIIFAVAVFTGLSVVVFLLNRVDYEVLYRDLSPEDAQAIAAKLKEGKKDYQVQGTSILVAGPKSDVDKLRLEIAGSGLARSGRVGYEIFDKNQFGMTDFTEQINLQRALEGELSRTISSLAEISEARVHLVLPKDSIFEDKKQEAKASVAVRLKKGSELSKSSIAGIKGLVAGAVPGLKSYSVSVVDDEGKLLSQPPPSDSTVAEAESGIREQFEREMVAKVLSILEPAVGRGKVQAKASIELDFNTTEQTEESFNPTPPAILSQQKSEERFGGSNSPSGVPGNAPAATGSTASPSDRSRQSEITNYEVSKMVRHTLQPKGSIRRISVAVLLDHRTIQTQSPDGKISTTSKPIPQQDLDAYKELVYAAVGYDKGRGDTVTLENVPFYTEFKPTEQEKPIPWYLRLTPGVAAPATGGWPAIMGPALKYISFIVLFLLVYLILFRPIKKRVFATLDGMALPKTQEQGVPQLGEGSPDMALPPASERAEVTAPGGEHVAAEGPVLGQGAADVSALDRQIEQEFLNEAQMLGMDGRKFTVIRKRLADKAQKEPEMLAQLVRSWIQER